MENNLNKKAVIISCFNWYSKRLIHIEKYLKDRNYDVTILTSDYNHIQKKYDKHLENIETIKYIHSLSYKKNLSIKRIFSHYFFAKKVEKDLKQIKPDLVYCLVPPNSLVKRISKLKLKLRYQLYYDIIDLWPESFNVLRGFPLIFNLWKNLRDKYLKQADKIIVECNFYKKTVSQVFDGEIQTLYLTAEPLDTFKYVNNSESETINLCYLGSINNLIDIHTICDIVSSIIKYKPVNVKIVGAGEKKDIFIDELKKIGTNVEFYENLYDIEKISKIFEDCHFAINIYKQDLAVGLTIKSIDYFRMGIPILNSIQGDTYDLVNKEKIGINLEDFSIEKFQSFIENYDEVRTKIKIIFDNYFNVETIQKRINFLN